MGRGSQSKVLFSRFISVNVMQGPLNKLYVGERDSDHSHSYTGEKTQGKEVKFIFKLKWRKVIEIK